MGKEMDDKDLQRSVNFTDGFCFNKNLTEISIGDISEIKNDLKRLSVFGFENLN